MRRQVQHPGDHRRVDGRAEHRAGPQDLLGVPADPAQPGQDGRLQGLGRTGLAGGQPSQGLHDEQRMPAGPVHDRRGELALAGLLRQSGHRLVRQRSEVEPLGDVGQDVEGVGTLLGAQCGEHEQPGAGAACRAR